MVSATGLLYALIAVVAVQRVSELRLAKRNEAWARQQGAHEYGAGHYPAFFLLHGAWLLLWPIEAWRAGPTLSAYWWLWLLLFVAAEGLRYWAIATLGSRWNTRILVIPGLAPISGGPYRWLHHPNYVAVVIELAALPLVFGAWRTALVVGLANLVILLGVRIPAETRALRSAASHDP